LLEVIPGIVRQFIAKYIHSVDVLEILLLLRQESRKEWGVLAVSKALLLELASVEVRLDHLLSAGLLTVRNVGGERVYTYHPSTGDLASAVNELAKWYSSHRVALISLIFSNPAGEVRTYPDTSERTERGGE
jgi:hypothetical protein